jgi:Na+/H+ antiporter NhaD/arsenite permease-like protein
MPVGLAIALASICLLPDAAQAATALDGAQLSWTWALPFAGILLSIAAGPLLFPKIWHHHYGKISALWSAAALVPIAALFGTGTALDALVHALLGEYLSFIVLLFALYTVAGGVLVTGDLAGTPGNNALLLTLGTLLASIVGTTGAAMILIRPLLRANIARAHNAHVVVFFIFLVANIGGALSPLGDPPLFIGFLRGIDFLWTARELWFETALVGILVLAAFLAIDAWLFRRDRAFAAVCVAVSQAPIRIRGAINLLLIAAIIAAILVSATWNPHAAWVVRGSELRLENLLRDAALVAIALASVALTPEEHREANGFSWEPIREVAKLFAGIFVCVVPVTAMLAAGRNGAFAFLLGLLTDPAGKPHEAAYFWSTGLLSAFLDNAPTYLVFFELAGGDPQVLMGPRAGTLAAISMGAVYMGALTYIGNAPNFMVYAIANERGVKMPSFAGYMVWAGAILIPVFGLLTVVSFR